MSVTDTKYRRLVFGKKKGCHIYLKSRSPFQLQNKSNTPWLHLLERFLNIVFERELHALFSCCVYQMVERNHFYTYWSVIIRVWGYCLDLIALALAFLSLGWIKLSVLSCLIGFCIVLHHQTHHLKLIWTVLHIVTTVNRSIEAEAVDGWFTLLHRMQKLTF